MPKKKKMSKYYFSIALVAAAIIGGIGSRFILGPDNFIEESAEKIIERNSGFSIDLSPDSKEVLT